MSIRDFMISNGNNGSSNTNPPNNVVDDQPVENDFDLSQVGYDEETQSFFSREDVNPVEEVQNTPSLPPNTNISQLPEFQALQQQNQQLQNQLLQVVQYMQQQGRQPQTQQQQVPQFDVNEVMSNPQTFQQYMEHNNKNIVQQVMQALQPRIQQYDTLANTQAQQQKLTVAYQQAQQQYPDFEQVISTDVNKALNYVKEFGSFQAAYKVMKAENSVNGNQPSKTNVRRQRISRVENGSRSAQENGMNLNNKVYDPQNSARNSALAALDEILSKR